MRKTKRNLSNKMSSQVLQEIETGRAANHNGKNLQSVIGKLRKVTGSTISQNKSPPKVSKDQVVQLLQQLDFEADFIATAFLLLVYVDSERFAQEKAHIGQPRPGTDGNETAMADANQSSDRDRPVAAAEFLVPLLMVLECGDPMQMHMMLPEVCTLCGFVADMVGADIILANRAMWGLRRAVEILQQRSVNTILSAHTSFLQVCLVAKQYKTATRILNQTKFDVDIRKNQTVDLLRYFYYGGRAYTGLKEWDKALDSFRTCVSIPSHVLSKVAVEAYQQMTLVSLIKDGVRPRIPKYAPAAFLNACKRFESAAQNAHFAKYNGLVQAFREGNLADLNKFVKENEDGFKADGTHGLVKQAVQAALQRKILSLRLVYLSMDVALVAKQLAMDTDHEATNQNVEQLLYEMVLKGNGAINLDEHAQVVRFNVDQVSHDESIIDVQNNQIKDLLQKLTATDLQITSDPEYVKTVLSVKKANPFPSEPSSSDIFSTSAM